LTPPSRPSPPRIPSHAPVPHVRGHFGAHR
jgi:hypothetical protein